MLWDLTPVIIEIKEWLCWWKSPRHWFGCRRTCYFLKNIWNQSDRRYAQIHQVNLWQVGDAKFVTFNALCVKAWERNMFPNSSGHFKEWPPRTWEYKGSLVTEQASNVIFRYCVPNLQILHGVEAEEPGSQLPLIGNKQTTLQQFDLNAKRRVCVTELMTTLKQEQFG